MISLVIEASTYAGSAAVVDGGRVLAERTVAMRGREHEALMPAVADVLADAGLVASGLDAVVCGAGPGAFTSLRIAGGIAKGIAMAADRPLVPVPSLALLVAAIALPPGSWLAAMDAMRGEHYAQRFDVQPDGAIAATGGLSIVATGRLGQLASEMGATLVGPGQAGHDVAPHARGAARLTNMIDVAHAADLASWEPAYGRLAEAQVQWEATHGRPLAAS